MGASILGIDLGFNLPSFSSAGIGYWVVIIAIIILFILLVGIIVWFYIQSKVYYIQIRDFENISGQGYQLIRRDKARLVKIGAGGEELLLTKKSKQYRTAYGKKMGKNEYWFCKGQDGYMYNIILGDLDAKMGMLDIEPIDRDMRYMHVAIRKNIEDRYKKQSAMEKYAPVVISFVFFVILIIAMWLLISKTGDLINSANEVVKSSTPIAQTLTNAIGKLDTICSASGIR